MLFSQLLVPTLKEVPAEAELISHQLMLRAGLIRKLAAGIYTYLPLGLRVIKKVEAIIREEMDKIGAQEVLLPAVQPAELWKESGRWDLYGKELLRFQDRHNRDFCLGPTHEEVITDLVRREVRSYRQLPLLLYQIQTKFRDEVRPRFGLMRGREFGMKDAYSFDGDEEAARKSYQKVWEAYLKIFSRVGLDVKPVEADTGAIGGSLSHEFMVPSAAGEDAIVTCEHCGYAANVEMVPCPVSADAPSLQPEKELTKVYTPGMKSVAEVASFLNVNPQQLVKTVLFFSQGDKLAALVRGDHEVNPVKLKNLLSLPALELYEGEQEEESVPLGFVGPVGFPGKLVADQTVMRMANFVTGANELNYHYLNVRVGRDFEVSQWGDIRMAEAEDPCPRCGKSLTFGRGIEVGQCFYLGTKYSRALKATYLDEKGQEKEIVMGCYGIGVGRTVAAVIEQSHDKDGIIFPLSIAPFQVIVLPVNPERPEVMSWAKKIYQGLLDLGAEVILHDGEARAGAKFKDADLLGIPLIVTVGEKGLKKGLIDIKRRRSSETKQVKAETVVAEVSQALASWPSSGLA